MAVAQALCGRAGWWAAGVNMHKHTGALCKREVLQASQPGEGGTLACRYRMPSQQHFYMETQAAMAVPGEDGCLTVHSGTQSLDSIHQGLTMCTGLPANKVNVGEHCAHARRGGKQLSCVAELCRSTVECSMRHDHAHAYDQCRSTNTETHKLAC